MEKEQKEPKEIDKKKNRPRNNNPSLDLSAVEKAQAVLAVWTEKTSPAEVCRQMNIKWVTFKHWQQRAMEGMLQALESRVNLTQGTVLNPRLQALLMKRYHAPMVGKMEAKLAKLAKAPVNPEEKVSA